MAADQAYLVVLKSFLFKTSLVLFLGYCERIVIGTVTLSPMTVAPVCRVGDPLQITCITSVEFIRWNILQANEQGTLVEVANSVLITASDANQMTHRVVNSATFTFMRTSAEDTTPLISTLSIDSTSIGLNGTVVRCLEVGGSKASASTIIHINDINSYRFTPVLPVTLEAYSSDNVTVTVEWAIHAIMGAMYNITVTVFPFAPLIYTESTNKSKAVLLYNTMYNLSVTAAGPCGATANNFIFIHYANCGHPELLSTESNESVPNVTGYDDIIPVEGTIIRFSCPPGLELSGLDSATCTENGEWEPDPSGLICNDSKGEGLLNQDEIIAVASSVAVVSILALIMLLTSCLCRQCCRKKKRLIDSLPPAVTYRKQLPQYDDVQFPPKREMPMKPNESYRSR